MKSIFTTLLLLTGLLISTNTFGQAEKSDTLAMLINKSKTKNTKLFMVFGFQGCTWCRCFDRFHSDSTVMSILGKYFTIAKIDIKSKAGSALYKTYGDPGTPSWLIFDAKGNVLADSKGEKGNVGYPANDNEINHYIQALKKTIPPISNTDCDTLVSKLKKYTIKKIILPSV